MRIGGYTPVWAPWDGGNKANVREKDGILSDAIQGVVHLTEWQSVELELKLNLQERQHPDLTTRGQNHIVHGVLENTSSLFYLTNWIKSGVRTSV